MWLYLNKDWIFQHLASVRKRKPAVKRTGSDHSVRILKSNRKREQDSVPTTDHHALRTFTALVERTIALVNAFGAGTAVFMVEGLQLIIAILLMVLGVIIVYTSGKELFNKKAEVKHSKEGKLA